MNSGPILENYQWNTDLTNKMPGFRDRTGPQNLTVHPELWVLSGEMRSVAEINVPPYRVAVIVKLFIMLKSAIQEPLDREDPVGGSLVAPCKDAPGLLPVKS